MTNEPLRVLVLSQQPGVGGAERVTFMGLKRAKGLQVTVLGPESQCRFATELGLSAERLDLPSVQAPVLGKARLLPLSFKVRQVAKRIRADVLYANAMRAIGYGLGVRGLGGPPLVAHVHDLLVKGGPHLIKGERLGRKFLVGAIERVASQIIVPSKAAGDAFPNSTKLNLVPNGIDLEHFRPARNKISLRESLGLPPSGPIVGTLTRADPGKAMVPFLDVAAIVADVLPEAHFLLVGGVSFPHEVLHYERVVNEAESRFGPRMSLTGRVEDPLPWIQSMDVLIHLGVVPESFGLPLIEAMACEVPVVAYRWGGMAEVVAEGSTGYLVDPLDIEAAGLAAAAVLTSGEIDPKECRRLCEEKYDLTTFAARLSEIVKDAAS